MRRNKAGSLGAWGCIDKQCLLDNGLYQDDCSNTLVKSKMVIKPQRNAKRVCEVTDGVSYPSERNGVTLGTQNLA